MFGLPALLLVSILLTTGCSGVIGPKYAAGFSAVPADCAAALKPAEPAIKAFAGEVYSSATEFEDDDRSVSPYSQYLGCAQNFGTSVLREPLAPHRKPMWRNVEVSYFVSMYPIMAGETTRSLMEREEIDTRSPRPTPVAGIGDDAVTWVKARSPRELTRVTVEFKIGNLSVQVETSGKDWSGVAEAATVFDSAELRADLQSGAESIAKALARQVPSALPTTVLTMPSRTKTTTTTTTTTAIRPVVWDPCLISERSITAAGLEERPDIWASGSDRSRCGWDGAWYRVVAHSTEAPFESSVYENYVNPKPVTIGSRHAVQTHSRSSDLFCVLSFELPVEANIPHAGGRTLEFEASLTESHSRAELCDELVRVVTVLQGDLPPTT